MAVLGILARVDVPHRQRVLDELQALDGVSTFSVEEKQRVGILIEADTLDTARAILAAEVDTRRGILGTWPVFADFESEFSAAPEPSPVSARQSHEGAGDG